MGFGPPGVSRPVGQKPSLFQENGSSLRAAAFTFLLTSSEPSIVSGVYALEIS